MKINRLTIFIYNVLIVLAFIIRIVVSGPTIYGHVWMFWGLFAFFLLGVFFLSNLTFFHPTPLEIVSYHINLIMRHSGEEENAEYDRKNKLYLTNRFIDSDDFKFFYYGDCCAKITEYSHMKIKLALNQEDFNEVYMIIKTMDDRYIKFHIIKNTTHLSCAFLYDWVIDQIEYSDEDEFSNLVNSNE